MFGAQKLVATGVVLVAAGATAWAQSYDQQNGYLPPVDSSQQLASDMQPLQTYDYGAPQPDYGYQEQPSSGGPLGWLSGDWYLKVGGAVLHAPKFEGASG